MLGPQPVSHASHTKECNMYIGGGLLTLLLIILLLIILL